MLRAYLMKLTMSEFNCFMVGNNATIAGFMFGLLVLYGVRFITSILSLIYFVFSEFRCILVRPVKSKLSIITYNRIVVRERERNVTFNDNSW